MVDPLVILGLATGALLFTKKVPSKEVPTREEIQEKAGAVIQAVAPSSIGECVKLEEPAYHHIKHGPLTGRPGVSVVAIMVPLPGQEVLIEKNKNLRQEHDAKIKTYQDMGWSLHWIPVGERLIFSVLYVCPPGVLPIEIQAKIKAIKDKGECTITSYWDGTRSFPIKYLGKPIIDALQKDGWTSKKRDAPGYSGSMGAKTFLCPPGKEPK